MLEPRRIVRWLHVGRLAVVSAILLAAIFAWERASPEDTRIVVLAFAAAVGWTTVVGWRTEVQRRSPERGVLALQAAIDLLLTTAIVHVTGGGASQFTALYILVIATVALLLPGGPALATAGFGCALYAMDVAWLRPSTTGVGLWLQLLVFAVVAVGTGLIAARLRQAGAGGERLAAALVRARVEATDILRNIRSGIVTVDAEGRLLYANPAAAAILELELEPRLGQPILPELDRIAPALSEVLYLAAARGARTTRAEGTIQRGDQGGLLGMTTTVSEPPEGAGPQARTGTAIFSDITASKRLEALHLRAERLEAVAELSASLAHEIKNPLASIRSAVEQVARLVGRAADGTLDAEDVADVTTLATLSVRESDRLAGLLSEFLDFARARVTRVERVDVAVVAQQAALAAGAHPSAAGVRVHVELPEGDDAIVDGDRELLHRTLFNLTLNAAQATAAAHTDGGGRVRLEVQCPDDAELPVGLAFASGAVAVHVVDDGAGIPDDVLPRLFDPFFTTKPEGSGLGLAIVQRAVQAHRGVVLVESGGEGARFTVLLPRGVAAEEPTMAEMLPYLRTPVRPQPAIA